MVISCSTAGRTIVVRACSKVFSTIFLHGAHCHIQLRSVTLCLFLNQDLKLCYLPAHSLNTDPTCCQAAPVKSRPQGAIHIRLLSLLWLLLNAKFTASQLLAEFRRKTTVRTWVDSTGRRYHVSCCSDSSVQNESPSDAD